MGLMFCEGPVENQRSLETRVEAAPSPRNEVSVKIPIHVMKTAVEELRNSAEMALVMSTLYKIQSQTIELFDSLTVELSEDPEAGTWSFVVTADAVGEPREIADRRRDWFRRTYGILGDCCHRVQLVVNVTE